jgi:serine protease Do
MDPKELAKITQVTAGSAADHDGFKPGDEIISLDGQPLLSVADFQWVLQNASATGSLPAKVRRDGKTIDLTVTLRKGWRRGDISWRTTTWELRRIGFGGMKLGSLDEEASSQAGLALDHMALRVIHVGEFGDHAVAKRAGFRKGDLIVSFDGKDHRTTESELLADTLQQKRRGDEVSVTVIRDGTRRTLSFELP